MELSAIRAIATRVEEGEWRKDLLMFDGLELKCRGAGNSDWLLAKATRIKPDTSELEAQRILVREAGVTDWNLTDNGEPVPFSKEALDEKLLSMPVVVAAAYSACLAVSLERRTAAEAAAGN